MAGHLGNTNAEKWTEEKALKLANDLIDWQNEPPLYSYDQYGNPIKLIKANLYYKYYLSQKGYGIDLIGNLSDRFKSFSELISKSKQIQESKISELAMLGFLNAQFTSLFMKNHHGYKDKTETDITTNGQSLLPQINVTPYKIIDHINEYVKQITE